jgi:hypothetical protein
MKLVHLFSPNNISNTPKASILAGITCSMTPQSMGTYGNLLLVMGSVATTWIDLYALIDSLSGRSTLGTAAQPARCLAVPKKEAHR